MPYIGSWKVNDSLVFSTNTHNPTNGMANNADALPTYHVYKNNSATPVLTGTMALLNNPNTIGFYTAQFMATGTIFDKGSNYNIYIRAVVNSVTGTMAHNFQIEAEVDSNTVSVPVGISTGTFLDAVADTVWDELLSGHLNPISAGHTLFSRIPSGTVLVGDKTGFYLATPQNFDLIGNVSGTVSLVLNVQNPVTAGNVTGSVFGSVNSVTQPVGILTGSLLLAIADQVWDEALSGHLGVGSTGEKLNSAGSSGDPWNTSLGSYAPGTAGHYLASRMPSGTVIVGVNQDKTGYFLASPQSVDFIGNISGTITNVINLLNPVGIVTGTFIDSIADKVWDEILSGHLIIGSAGAGLSNVPSANDNADALLKRDWTVITGESARSVLNALRFIRNKFSTTASPGSVTVYKEDDSTPAYTKPLTTDASADPIVEG